MKKLKISICALLVLFSGFIFAACGETKQDFKIDDFEIGTTSYGYDGQSHIFEVKYNDVDIDVTYSLNNKSSFKDASELNVSDAGTYNIYYKISADGYNDYTSNDPISLVIAPKDVTVTMQNYECLTRNLNDEMDIQWSNSGVVEGDSLNIGYSIVDFNKDTAQAGDSFTLRGVDNENTNYNISFVDGVFLVKDDIEVLDANNETVGYYSDLQTAINNAVEGQTLKLNHDIEVNSTVEFTKGVKIDGQGQYSIKASSSFEGTNMFLMQTSGKYVYFNDVDVDANQKARIIKVSAGKLIVDNSNLTGGYLNNEANANAYAPGVFITNYGKFAMNGGSITGNTVENNSIYYVKYSTDLWIGANALGEVYGAGGSQISLNGGTIGNMFVNANEFSASDAGKFTMNGGNIQNLYVEYDAGYGANFQYNAGTIANLLIATGNEAGEFVESDTNAGRTYRGGHLVEVITNGSSSYVYDLKTALINAQEGSVINLHKDVVVDEILNITRSVIINANGYEIKASSNFVGLGSTETKNATNSIFNIATGASEVVLTINDAEIDGNSVARGISAFAGTVQLNNTTISNGKKTDNRRSGGVFISNSASFIMNGGSIINNDANDNQYTKYCADLWIGANATGAIVQINGTVGNVFVNSNEYSANNPGSFTMTNGTVTNLYVEYDAGYGATFNLAGGSVQKLMIATGAKAGDYITVDDNAGIYVGGAIVVEKGETKTPYYSLYDAMAYAKAGSEITLYKDVEVYQTLVADKSLIINGQGKYSISAGDTFVGREVISVAKNDVILTMKDITVDANEQARVIKISAGTLNINGATITGGATTDSYIGGVYVTGSANFNMTSGTIAGNKCAEAYSNDGYLQYSADLWIGANAVGSLASATITGGTIGNMFVNANEYSANNPGSFIINGGTIENLYLEHDAGFSATLEVKGGAIENLFNAGVETISKPTTGTYYGYNKNN